jgi:uncharacterized protein (TIGR00369 family)
MSTEDTLARWQAEADAITSRQAGRAPAPVPREEAAGRSGLELLREMIAGRLPGAPMLRAMKALLVHVEPGAAVFQGRPDADFFNPMGGVHGGWYATLLDSCMGCAVHTTLPLGRAYATLELKVNLVRAIEPEARLVRAEGRIVHGGRQVATAEGRLVGPDGKLYAHGTTTCLIFEVPPR